MQFIKIDPDLHANLIARAGDAWIAPDHSYALLADENQNIYVLVDDWSGIESEEHFNKLLVERLSQQ